MTVAFDASSASAGTGNLSWTHTPVGTPRGIVVIIVQDATAADQVSGVTYGGTAMAEVALSPVLAGAGTEDSAIYGYFLGASVPSGAQTVAVTVTAGANKQAGAVSYTAAVDMSVEDTSSLDSASQADPSVALTTTVETAIVGGLCDGHSAATSVTPGANYTQVAEIDFGSQIGNIQRGTANFAAGTPACNWSNSADADEAGVLAIAVKEDGPVVHEATAAAAAVVTLAALAALVANASAALTAAVTIVAQAAVSTPGSTTLLRPRGMGGGMRPLLQGGLDG